jgi:hypothetical protein
MKDRTAKSRGDVIVGFKNHYPVRANREILCDGRGLHIYLKNKFEKVVFGKGGYILERLLEA